MYHAELNAILNKNVESLEKCTLYVELFPCIECARTIIECGIKKIYYINHSDKGATIRAKRMFQDAGVEYW